MRHKSRNRLTRALAGIIALSASLVAVGLSEGQDDRDAKLSRINHFVVIYQENHSFDNLYGQWEGVEGLADVQASQALQVSQSGAPFLCLKQNDPNLTSPPLPASCFDPLNGGISSAFGNQPFNIDRYIPAAAMTCPNGTPGGAPGGCTRDLVHRFYQEQYQLNRGLQNRYTTGSDAVGLTMGFYATRALPIYRYLHAPGHPHYAIADHFFQAAFGGSFLNHQWLVAAASPVFAGALTDGSANDLHSKVDANGMPTAYPLYAPTGTVKDSSLTVPCPSSHHRTRVRGLRREHDAAVVSPYLPGTAVARRLPPLTNPTIGDRLSNAGIDWAWYSGGWSNANGDIGGARLDERRGPGLQRPAVIAGATFPNCPDQLFQFHHQAFNYFAAFAPGTAARAEHLRDEQDFERLAAASTRRCELKAVSFIKPIGAENEHPGYASEERRQLAPGRPHRRHQPERLARATR